MALSGSLGARGSLDEATRRLRFVQYDPIRRPARAQDLILHQRVEGYRAGDLDRSYGRLGLEEDYLHVYGAMDRDLLGLLHPRPAGTSPDGPYTPHGIVAEVLDALRREGPVHPRRLAEMFGPGRVVNAWGGSSAATTGALEELHRHGLARVARRESGVKVYAAASPPPQRLPPHERLRRVALQLARSLAPVSDASLAAALRQVERGSGPIGERAGLVVRLLESGDLAARTVDGERYVWPADMAVDGHAVAPQVRFLAPFDPVVWDRRRFEHLWGWAYRFEAYTPPAKRRLGYYALPMFLGDRAIGWVNVERAGGALAVDAGFAGRPLRGRAFRRAFDREAGLLEQMVAGG